MCLAGMFSSPPHQHLHELTQRPSQHQRSNAAMLAHMAKGGGRAAAVRAARGRGKVTNGSRQTNGHLASTAAPAVACRPAESGVAGLLMVGAAAQLP